MEGRSNARVLDGLGRKGELDEPALERLVLSTRRYRNPDVTQEIRDHAGLETPFEFLGAKTYGGAIVLDAICERLGIKRALARSLAGCGYGAPIERLLFVFVAKRALDPGSKLAAEHWVAAGAFIPGLLNVEGQQLYRAMDCLHEAHVEIQRDVFWSVRNLFNLAVDELFIDTTRTSFEIEGVRIPTTRTGPAKARVGLRRRTRRPKERASACASAPVTAKTADRASRTW